MIICTIGFTKKSAETFFGLLGHAGVQVVVDVRLRPNSQLAGFAKQRDLPYFLKNLINCDYVHNLDMAPTDAILDGYRADKSWPRYVERFDALLHERDLISTLDRVWWAANRACLLCSEHEPDHCHRRLVVEYLAFHWPDVEIRHLM